MEEKGKKRGNNNFNIYTPYLCAITLEWKGDVKALKKEFSPMPQATLRNSCHVIEDLKV
jgi:hypothetical protein